MASPLSTILRCSPHYRRFIGQCSFQIESLRTLYSKTTLGIDNFVEQRDSARRQLANIAPRFKDKMKQFSDENSSGMIFTEDLKNMLFLTETDEDVDLVTKMMKKFNQQNKELRFGNFIFGTVVMRVFYILNKPDDALKCFRMPELQGFFDQLMTYQILMDLLYNNEKYQEMLDLFGDIKERQTQGIKYPKNVVVLAAAACYKLNTPESYEFVKKFWKELAETGHKPMRRAVTFCAALALNQGHPVEALEMVSATSNQNYTTIRNIKVSALIDVGRIEDCIPILKSVLSEDRPETAHIQTFNKDVVAKIKDAVEKTDSQELKSEFARVEKFLKEQGNISDLTLDEQLCVEIASPPVIGKRLLGNENQFRRVQRTGNFQQSEAIRLRRSFGGISRPGLSDIA